MAGPSRAMPRYAAQGLQLQADQRGPFIRNEVPLMSLTLQEQPRLEDYGGASNQPWCDMTLQMKNMFI